MSCEYQVNQRKPASALFCCSRMKPENQPDNDWCQRCEYKQGMAGAAVIGEITHGITQWYEYVKIRHSAAYGSPEQSTASELTTRYRFTNGSTQSDLCY
jgi:hypothetical protein